MRIGTLEMLGLAVVGALAVSGTAWSALPSSMVPAQGASVVINEVQYDPSPSGGENAYEWVELLNVGSTAVSLEGWTLEDNRASDEIPPVSLNPGEFLVVAGGDGFGELFPDFGGQWVTVGGSIGNGLGNTGDQVRLVAADGTVVDGMSYGDNAEVLNPSAADVAPGHSLERVPAGADTDTADDWLDQPAPSPGGPASGGRPTAVPPTDLPPTLPPGARIVLNEHLPAPREVDWDGDGTAGKDDEWVELYNPGDVPIDLRGWQMDDVAAGGSSPYEFSEPTVIAPRGYLVVFKKDSGLALNNGGDSIRLLSPDGAVVDSTEYHDAAPDTSFSRENDGSGPWTDTFPPSPGQQNLPAGGTPGPGPVPTSGPGPGPSITTTPSQATTPTAATGTPGSPNPPTVPVQPTGPAGTATPGGLYLPYLITEVMFDPLTPGNDAAYEWLELHNPTDSAIVLAGWSVGDRSGWDSIPDVEIASRGFLIVASSPLALAGVDAVDVPHVLVADGRIGGGLANGGDVVRLRGPTGRIVDAVSYGNNIDAFDPAVPIGPPGFSVERLPSDVDSDTADDWWPQPAPSPGMMGTRHTGPPNVRLNEILPAPHDVDWNSDGTADYTDEWVEIHNGADYAADMTGWRLEVGEPRRWTYQMTPGTKVPQRGFLLLHRSDTGLRLGNDSDTLRLVRDDGVVADQFSWESGAGYDRSWSRTADGDGEWTNLFAVTPGGPNTPEPNADRNRASQARPPATARPEEPRRIGLHATRGVDTGIRVQVRGRITVAPGVFGEREAYIGDSGSGLKIYLRRKGQHLPEVSEGKAVLATGVLKDYHGERELVLDSPTDLWVVPGEPVAVLEPQHLPTGDVGEPSEGRLVRLRGRVVEVHGLSLEIDDGTGAARVVRRRATDVRFDAVSKGTTVAVVGVVTQYASAAPWEGGYRLTPRRVEDIHAAGVTRFGVLPSAWPQTGRADCRTGWVRPRVVGKSELGAALRHVERLLGERHQVGELLQQEGGARIGHPIEAAKIHGEAASGDVTNHGLFDAGDL